MSELFDEWVKRVRNPDTRREAFAEFTTWLKARVVRTVEEFKAFIAELIQKLADRVREWMDTWWSWWSSKYQALRDWIREVESPAFSRQD